MVSIHKKNRQQKRKREFCKQGHPWIEENLVPSGASGKQCKICLKAKQKEYGDRKRNVLELYKVPLFERRKELKLIFRELFQKLPGYTGKHNEQRIRSLVVGYRCALYRDKFGLDATETSKRLGITFARVYELWRKFEMRGKRTYEIQRRTDQEMA